MRRKLIRYGVFLTMVVLFCNLASRYLTNSRDSARRASCQSNIKNIALGIKQYMHDYDDRFPLAVVNGRQPKGVSIWHPGWTTLVYPVVGWADGFQPYVKSVCILQCPNEMTPPGQLCSPRESGYTDYWLNRNISGLSMKDVTGPQNTFLVGDGDGRDHNDASYNKSEINTSLKMEPEQPVWFERHMGGANYAFTDGHVSWLLPEAVSNLPGAPHTFAIH